MRFMTNMNDQYINESDNEEDSDDDVDDIDSGKKLVNVFDNDEDDDDDDGIMGKEDNVDINSNKRGETVCCKLPYWKRLLRVSTLMLEWCQRTS